MNSIRLDCLKCRDRRFVTFACLDTALRTRVKTNPNRIMILHCPICRKSEFEADTLEPRPQPESKE